MLGSLFIAGHASAEVDMDGETRKFGDLSLSLSLMLSKPAMGGFTQMEMASSDLVKLPDAEVRARRLSELSAEVAAIEEKIRTRQLKMLGLQPDTNQSKPLMFPDDPGFKHPDGMDSVGKGSGASTGRNMDNESDYGNLELQARNNRTDIFRSGVKPGISALEWTALFIALLVVSGILWVLRVKVSKPDAPPNSRYTDLKQSYNSPEEAMAEEVSVQPGQVASGAEHTSAQSLLPPEYEMLEEADIYLRFGHDKLAEEVLREAISVNPKNPQPYLTLLRIFFSREDKDSFLEFAQKLQQLGDRVVWSKVVEMGKNLDGGNPLYR